MNNEHPPLLKELSAFPLAAYDQHLASPFFYDSWHNANQWQFAQDFLYKNSVSADSILLLGRLPMMLLSLLLGLYIFKWSKELFGTIPGLIALLLYCLSPNIIAHSRYVTTDIGVSAFFFITIYYFYKFLKYNKLNFLIAGSIFLGFSLASKFSAVFIIPILIILFLLHKIITPQSNKHFKHFLFVFIIMFFIANAIVWASYGFEFKKPMAYQEIQSLQQQRDYIVENDLISDQNDLNKALIRYSEPGTLSGNTINYIANNIPIPAFTYFLGLKNLYLHNYYGHLSYLLGNYSQFGWWYYFPITILAKTPIPTLLFLSALSGLFLVYLINKISCRSLRLLPLYIYFLVVPPLIYFIISMSSHINLGWRHVAVIYPFIFVSIGFLFLKFPFFRPITRTLFIVLLFWYIASSILIYPYYLAYFNEFFGGPKKGPLLLVDSNIDWGQDIKRLKSFMNKNDISYVCLSYFGQANLDYYDIDYRYLPDSTNFSGLNDIDCVVAISITSLLSEDGKFKWLLSYSPDYYIGYSIYVYDFRK